MVLRVVVTAVFLYLVLAPALVVGIGKKHVYADIENIPDFKVGIVFGAGIYSDGTPRDMLRDRLITTADLYEKGVIEKILVSGDNRYENYNEPEAMFKYLVNEAGIPEEDVVRDYAGRRTYDTCARANEIWSLDEAILISQGYHLPRAIFLCNELGVTSAGYSATLNAYRGERWFKIREIMAIHKSIWDLFVWEPAYLGGEQEDDFDTAVK